MTIRDADSADAAAIAEIYNDAVAHTTAIWNERTVDTPNRAAWIADRRKAGFPVLVAVAAGQGEVVGYASYGDWRAFDGYRHTVEHSVYVRSNRRGAGIGRRLMEMLIVRARADGKHVMVAAIEAGNEVSIGLHRALGFEAVGHLREVGTKFGKWLDLAFLQLTLDSRPDPDGRSPV
ncbi:MAG: N-acetyltransferase [Telmatospirillum sp.]|nr:N-acetyltransferase [Telmatospirillum sp.]